MIINFDGDLTKFYLDLKQNKNENMLRKISEFTNESSKPKN